MPSGRPGIPRSSTSAIRLSFSPPFQWLDTTKARQRYSRRPDLNCSAQSLSAKLISRGRKDRIFCARTLSTASMLAPEPKLGYPRIRMDSGFAYTGRKLESIRIKPEESKVFLARAGGCNPIGLPEGSLIFPAKFSSVNFNFLSQGLIGPALPGLTDTPEEPRAQVPGCSAPCLHGRIPSPLPAVAENSRNIGAGPR